MQFQRTRAQKSRAKPKLADIEYKSIQLTGSGNDEEDEFFASGWLNPLPPQHGIPGWQRVTFMKHFLDDYDQVDKDDLWAYEGVALPGGRMILGRWWAATAEPDFNVSFKFHLSMSWRRGMLEPRSCTIHYLYLTLFCRTHSSS
jgi:hypothetical protein